ncbi:hypothetical protein [Aeromicrobium sp.]|uniref:hypothetical protein n=1 Tax=Aeromicrobium sp. TaxID=1871063 RepID=UPI0030C5EBA8
MNLDLGRAVADAVLYEGYLLYPYRASSSKNQARWQFGVLSPPDAEAAGIGESSSMAMQCLLSGGLGDRTSLVLHLRFLQLQRRQVLDTAGEPVARVVVGDTTWLSWDEAVDHEVSFTVSGRDLTNRVAHPVEIAAGEDVEALVDDDGAPAGTMVRRRRHIRAEVRLGVEDVGGLHRLSVEVENRHVGPTIDKDDAIAHSFIGTHLLIEAHGPTFVSLLEPPDAATGAVAGCVQRRCWPVLGGAPGDTDLLLGLPIILYDYPEIAEQSTGALFDSTEIDEILTLRVLTMTDEEKAEARATDPRAREIIDRCEEMSPESMQQLHGILRDPGALDPMVSPSMAEPDWPMATDVRDLDAATFDTGDTPWWDPAADEAVRPESDVVVIDGVSVGKGSLVRVHPNRRADAQDIFFADQVARVTAVLSDVDGGTHVALVLVDDPAADMHEWYGRYFYFAPDELEPLPIEFTHHDKEESRP